MCACSARRTSSRPRRADSRSISLRPARACAAPDRKRSRSQNASIPLAGQGWPPIVSSSMILDDNGTAPHRDRARAPARAPARRLRDRQGAPRRDRLHLAGQPRRALHHLQEPSLPLRRPSAAPRPLPPAVLEAERQDRLQAAGSRGRRAIPPVDRQPPPPRVRARADARHLAPSRRAHPGSPRPALPRARTPPPRARVDQLDKRKTPGYRADPPISQGLAPLRHAPISPQTRKPLSSRHFLLVLK